MTNRGPLGAAYLLSNDPRSPAVVFGEEAAVVNDPVPGRRHTSFRSERQ